MQLHLSTLLKDIPGIGPAYQRKLERLEIFTVRDLLFHFPRRYEDVSRVAPIGSLASGEAVSVHGIIRTIHNRRSWKNKRFITEAIIEDESGSLPIMWFNQPYLTKNIKPGTRMALCGKPVQGDKGQLMLVSPEFELWRSEFLHTSRLVPFYPETSGLSSKWLRWKIHTFLPFVEQEVTDDLPPEVIEKMDMMPAPQALREIHFPKTLRQAQEVRAQFSFRELLKIRLAVLMVGKQHKQERSPIVSFDQGFVQRLVEGFEFSLTEDQRKATWEIVKDLQKPYPMQRLLEGDVGTGKTLVALIVSALVGHQGKQVALMAPTEILASQHFETFVKFLSRLGMPIGLYTRSMVKMYDPFVEHVRDLSVSQLKTKILAGEIKILIGTHAIISSHSKAAKGKTLLSEAKDVAGVAFKELALVIIDEQHRFGVQQRSHLVTQSSLRPHFLTMTATPIPRSLALTLYGNLQISLLRKFPAGRRNIVTRIITPLRRSASYEFIREKMKQGNQVYVICPVIEESEKLDTKAAMEAFSELSTSVFREFPCDLLHGRMKAREKEDAIRKFFTGQTQLLVATSVVEVGVDVPGASIMVIEGAERFGLSQIHQLRGRIGRRGQVGYCFLFTNSASRLTWARLRALTQSNDGFFLAEKDLEIRGPGQLLGTRQAGVSDIAMESLGNPALLGKVKEEADHLLKRNPDLSQYPALRQAVYALSEKLHME